MSTSLKSKYNNLYQHVQSAHPHKSKYEQQRITNEKWTTCHSNYSKRFSKHSTFNLDKYQQIIITLSLKARTKQRKSSITSFFDNLHLKSQSTSPKKINRSTTTDSNDNNKTTSPTKANSSISPHKTPTPPLPSAAVQAGSTIMITADHPNCTKQVQLIESINKRNTQILHIQELLLINTSQSITASNRATIKSLKLANNKDIKNLKSLKAARKRAATRRQKIAKAIHIAKQNCPEKLDWFSVKDGPGKPRYTQTAEGKDYETVLEALVDAHCSADPKRRSDTKVCVS